MRISRGFYGSFTWQCNNRKYKNIIKVEFYKIRNCHYLRQPFLNIFTYVTYTHKDSWVLITAISIQTILKNNGNGLSLKTQKYKYKACFILHCSGFAVSSLYCPHTGLWQHGCSSSRLLIYIEHGYPQPLNQRPELHSN